MHYENMRSWAEVRRAYDLPPISPVMREMRGRNVTIFWFRNGNGDVAEVVTRLRAKGVKVEVLWNEEEGLTGIRIER